MLVSFKTGLVNSNLNLANLTQVSIDGTKTNWKLLEDMVKDRKESDPDLSELTVIGSCGLHVVHGSFKSGASSTGWNIDGLFLSLW